MTSIDTSSPSWKLPIVGSLVRSAASLLPVRDGRWRATTLTVADGHPLKLELSDRTRRVTVTVTDTEVVIQGGDAASSPETRMPIRFASARNLAAGVARSHLRTALPDPESDDAQAVVELAAFGTVATAVARIGADRRDWSVEAYRSDGAQFVAWKRGAGTRWSGYVRIDGPSRVQLYVEGVRHPKIVELLGLALPPADAEPIVLARPDASTVLLRAFPALHHEPSPEKDDMLLGPGMGPVTVAVQIPPNSRPTRSTRMILTLECDVDLALMVLDALA